MSYSVEYYYNGFMCELKSVHMQSFVCVSAITHKQICAASLQMPQYLIHQVHASSEFHISPHVHEHYSGDGGTFKLLPLFVECL